MYEKVNFALFCELTDASVEEFERLTRPITIPMITGTMSVAIQNRRFVSVRTTSNEITVLRLCLPISCPPSGCSRRRTRG